MDLNLEHKYRKSRKNGTIYVTTRSPVSAERQIELESGAGELYLNGIQRNYSVDQIMQVAHMLGDVYKLRFKIDFSGESRGFAYLQYITDHSMDCMLEILLLRFRLANLSIKVFPSRNIRRLLLNNVEQLTPIQVYQKLRQMFHYIKLNVHEIRPQHYVYIILYRNNDDAAQAHHTFRTKIIQFGAEAAVEWLGKGSRKKSDLSCCVQLQRDEMNLLEFTEKDHCCIRF
ncbi:hypothetical protein ACLKA6_015858 [Drosophila palustris]